MGRARRSEPEEVREWTPGIAGSAQREFDGSSGKLGESASSLSRGGGSDYFKVSRRPMPNSPNPTKSRAEGSGTAAAG